MPDRFWVGGTASWDSTAGTKWAATSGGPGGASVPTIADDVFFDAGSNTGAAITVTIATGNTGARSINCTGFTRTITGTAAITVAGSVTLVAAMTYTHTGTMTFSGTGTLTTAGKTFSGVTVNGAGITLTLGDPLNSGNTRNITVTQGTFTTAGFAVSAGGLLSSNSNTRAINLGASILTLSSNTTAVDFTTSTGLTFNAGTSQINIPSIFGPLFAGGGRTFHNVAYSGGATTGVVTGANTFINFALNASSPGHVRFAANQTITGTLTVTATSTIQGFLASDTIGTPRTLTVATLSANNCDFRDIVLAGAAAGAAPTRGGDCGGNSGIVFPAPKTVYRVGTGTSWGTTNSWSLTSGGAGADANFPLAQDVAVIDNGTALTGTLSLNFPFNIGMLDCSTRTNSITLSAAAQAVFYGSCRLGSGVTVTGTSTQTFSGRGTMDFTSAGKTITFPVTVNAPGGTFRLLGAASLSNTFTFAMGTLDLNGVTLTTTTFDGSGSNTRTLAFGSAGIITVTGTGTVFNIVPRTNLTVTGTRIVNVTNSGSASISVAASAVSTEAQAISFNFTAGTYSLSLTGSVGSLNFTGFSGVLSASTRTIFGDLTLSPGMVVAASTFTTTFGSTSGTPRTIQTNGTTINFPINFNGVGGSWRLLSAVSLSSPRSVTHTNGTIDLNGFILTVGGIYGVGLGTKNLTFNGGTLACLDIFNNLHPTGYTTTAGTGTGRINMLSSFDNTFEGGDSTYNCTLNNGSANALTIIGSNTFTTLENSVQPTSFLFTAGTTTTLTNWNISGTAGNLVTIGSPTAANHTLSKASGTVSADYLSISHSTAAGGAVWYAGANSTNGGNNSGWLFQAAPSGVTHSISAAAAGAGAMSATAVRARLLAAAVAGAATFNASATGLYGASAIRTGASSFDVAATRLRAAASIALASGTGYSAATLLLGVGGSLSASGSANGAAVAARRAQAAAAGAGAATGSLSIARVISAAASGTGLATGLAGRQATVRGVLAGAGTATATPFEWLPELAPGTAWAAESTPTTNWTPSTPGQAPAWSSAG